MRINFSIMVVVYREMLIFWRNRISVVEIEGAEILEFYNHIQYQSSIKIKAKNGRYYLLTISNSKKFIVSEISNKSIQSKDLSGE